MIRYHNEVEIYLERLIEVLYKKQYFGFEDSAFEYVLKIYLFIEQKLLILNHKKSPNQLISKGEFYITYESSHHTSWYIFFDKQELDIVITYISNNFDETMSVINQ